MSVCSHLESVRSTWNRLHSTSLVLPVQEFLRKSQKNYFCTLPASTVWYVSRLTQYGSGDNQNLTHVSRCFGQHFITVFVGQTHGLFLQADAKLVELVLKHPYEQLHSAGLPGGWCGVGAVNNGSFHNNGRSFSKYVTVCVSVGSASIP